MEYIEKLPYIILALGVSILFWGLFAVFNRLKKKWVVSRKKRELEQLLALTGQSLEEILATAPYKYGHFQGEDGFRLWDERLENGFVHFFDTSLDAQLWIVKTYLSERDQIDT